MDKKLTLKLDKTVIERAKKFASSRKISLSKLIENYLDLLTGINAEDVEISAFVKSITDGESIPADMSEEKAREEYIEYLDEKYK